MSKTVYLKLRQLTKTNKADVYLSDIADVYADKKILARIKSIKVACFYKVKKDRACINVMQVISCINQLDDTLEINNIGESDAVIEYKKNDQPAWMNIVMTVIVCIIIFIGVLKISFPLNIISFCHADQERIYRMLHIIRNQGRIYFFIFHTGQGIRYIRGIRQ